MFAGIISPAKSRPILANNQTATDCRLAAVSDDGGQFAEGKKRLT
jgi:hypothetical protein